MPADETFDTPLLRRAHEFACEAHEGRDGDSGTGIDHPRRVGRLLRDAGCAEEVVAAGLLHDVLEDTDVRPEDLRERFGDELADLVAAVTESTMIGAYDRRKAALRGQVVESGDDAAVVFAADKLARLRTLNEAGEMPDPRKLDHYRASVRLLRERRPGIPLLVDLDDEMKRLDDAIAAAHADGLTTVLRDGRSISIRVVESSDAPALARAFERLSEDSRRRRFVVAPARLSDEDLRYLTEVDGRRHDALVAIDPTTGELVGEARYVREVGRPDTAEVAALVADDWQGHGVGTALLTELTRRARARGLTRYKAIVAPDNVFVLESLEKLGCERVGEADGQLELEFDFPSEGLSDRLAATLRWAARGHVRLLGEIARRAAKIAPVP